MPSSKLRLDRSGLAAALQSAKVASAVNSLAKRVAASATPPKVNGPLTEIPVRTRPRTASGGRLSARPAVDVTLAHPAGLRVEAKHGVLARAAAANGLEVRRK